MDRLDPHARPSSPRRSRPSPPPSATRPGARSTCSPTSTTTGVTAAEVAEQLRAAPQRGPPPPRQAGRRRLPRGRRRRGAERRRRAARRSATGPPASRSTLELPVRHDDLLVTLLGRALALLPAEQAEAMAEEVGVEYGRAMAAAHRAPRPTASARSAPRCTPSPTPSPPTASPPTPSSAATSCASSSRALPVRRRRHRAPGDLRRRPGHGARACSAPSTATPTAETESSLPMGDDVCVTVVEG